MTVWFVIPVVKEAAFRAPYAGERVRGRAKTDRNDTDERIGAMVVNRDGTQLMTGTSRMSDAARRALDGRKPAWLEIHTTFPPDWERPFP